MLLVFVEDSSSVMKWAAKFKRDRDSPEIDPRSDRPKTSTTDELVDAIQC